MRDKERFSPHQCRAGRGLLDWSQAQLAEACRLEAEAVELYERLEGALSAGELLALGRAFNRAGVIAIASGSAGEGARFSRPRLAADMAANDPFDAAEALGLAALGRAGRDAGRPTSNMQLAERPTRSFHAG